MNKIEIILDSLNDLGYSETFTENDKAFSEIFDQNWACFSKLVSYLTFELSKILKTDEFVNQIENHSDIQSFNLEICAFLKEMNCPYSCLTQGPIEERFKSRENKLKLVDFLISEYQSAILILANKPEMIQGSNSQLINESEESKAMKTILITLGFPKPPASTTAKEIWTRVQSKCSADLAKLPKNYLGKPLVNAMMTDEQWTKLTEINQALCDDFQMRRELLLTRLDVTIQSFKWADRLKSNNHEITSLYQQKRKELPVKPSVKPFFILAARDDLLHQEKTCSSRLMAKSELHKIIIPEVPDRGGRTCELQPPPPEMPAFVQRKNSTQPQEQRHDSSHVKKKFYNYSNKWKVQNKNFHPKGDFEKYQDADYHGGSGNSNAKNYPRGYNNGKGMNKNY